MATHPAARGAHRVTEGHQHPESPSVGVTTAWGCIHEGMGDPPPHRGTEPQIAEGLSSVWKATPTIAQPPHCWAPNPWVWSLAPAPAPASTVVATPSRPWILRGSAWGAGCCAGCCVLHWVLYSVLLGAALGAAPGTGCCTVCWVLHWVLRRVLGAASDAVRGAGCCIGCCSWGGECSRSPSPRLDTTSAAPREPGPAPHVPLTPFQPHTSPQTQRGLAVLPWPPKDGRGVLGAPQDLHGRDPEDHSVGTLGDHSPRTPGLCSLGTPGAGAAWQRHPPPSAPPRHAHSHAGRARRLVYWKALSWGGVGQRWGDTPTPRARPPLDGGAEPPVQ